MSISSISSLLSEYESLLAAAHVDSPRLCAEMIVGKVSNMSRAQLIAFGERTLNEAQLAAGEAMLARRLTGEPMAYILGRKEFYGREFMVNHTVLVPRPETELLVDLALQEFERSAPVQFADLGCGSGCIIGSLLKEAAAWSGTGVDISTEALEICALNLEELMGVRPAVKTMPEALSPVSVSKRAQLLKADFANPNCLPEAVFELIVSNPPYISAREYENLDGEVRNFEPRIALESGDDGLFHPRKVALTAERALKPGGVLLMEIGCGQGANALKIFSSSLWTTVEILPDLAGLDRVVRARRA